jgi:DNA-directed RNA polymerase subunit RPC12/RpoP
MAEITKIECQNCGGKATIDISTNIFKCEYCESQFLVERTGNDISMQPMIETMGSLKTGIDKTATELAIARIQKDIDRLNEQLQPHAAEWKNLTKLKNTKNNDYLLRWIYFFLILATIIYLIFSYDTNSVGSIVCSSLFIFLMLVMILSTTSNINLRKKQEKRYDQLGQIVIPITEKIAQNKTELEKHIKNLEQ